MQTVYTGELVRLRPFRDADELVSCAEENHYASFVHWGPHPLDEAGLRRQFAEHGAMPLPGNGQFAIELLDGEFAGGFAGTSYYAVNKGGVVAGVGTFVREHLRKQRLGVEARRLCMCFIFDNLGVNKIEATTLSTNIAAKKSLERCGMVRDGALQGVHFSQGCREDLVFYSLLREQWEAMDYRQKVQRGAQ